MTERAEGRRRYPEEVAGSAVLVGLFTAVPVAMVSLAAPSSSRPWPTAPV